MNQSQSYQRYFATRLAKIPAKIKQKLLMLLLHEKYESIRFLSFFSITSETHAWSEPENNVSVNALIQNIIQIQANEWENGIQNTVIHDKINHKITLIFFQYKSAIVHVGISETRDTILLKLLIKAICQRVSQISKKYIT